MVAVLIGAAVVILLAKLVSSTVGFVAALLLGITVAAVAARGSWRMIRGTDHLGGDETGRDPAGGEGGVDRDSGEG